MTLTRHKGQLKVFDNAKEATLVRLHKTNVKDGTSHHFDATTVEGSKSDTRKVNSF